MESFPDLIMTNLKTKQGEGEGGGRILINKQEMRNISD